jgi:hypothetical protein
MVVRVDDRNACTFPGGHQLTLGHGCGPGAQVAANGRNNDSVWSPVSGS